MSYNEKTSGFTTNFDINKSTVGAYTSIGYDIRLGKGPTFFGIKLGFNSGSVAVDGSDYRESLNAIEIGAGLRF